MGKILDELDIEVIPAHSPEAKGRIERLWETLQSRLPTEMRVRGIKTIDDANKFLPRFIDMFNNRFSVKPAKDDLSFVPLHNTKFLDTLLTAKIDRKTNGQGVFSLDTYKFQIDAPECRNKKITLVMSEKTGVKAMCGNKLYDFQFCDYYDNRHLATHMSEVMQNLIEKYLTADAKRDTKAS